MFSLPEDENTVVFYQGDLLYITQEIVSPTHMPQLTLCSPGVSSCFVMVVFSNQILQGSSGYLPRRVAAIHIDVDSMTPGGREQNEATINSMVDFVSQSRDSVSIQVAILGGNMDYAFGPLSSAFLQRQFFCTLLKNRRILATNIIIGDQLASCCGFSIGEPVKDAIISIGQSAFIRTNLVPHTRTRFTHEQYKACMQAITIRCSESNFNRTLPYNQKTINLTSKKLN